MTADEQNLINDAKEVLNIEANTLLDAKVLLNNTNTKSFLKAIDIIFNTKGKLVVIGVGKSGLVASKIAATLSSTGTPSFFVHPTEAMHGDLGMIDKEDSILAISYSGASDELVEILPHLKKIGIKIISFAKTKNSPLGIFGDCFINIKVNKEACPLNIAPTSSTTLSMALGDALAVCLMKKRSFKKEDFAFFHPGGSLGRALFVKAKDIMNTKNLPIINKNDSIKNAILIMSEGRLGCCVIIGDNSEVIAILSDGDLRRAMLKKDFSIDANALLYANKNPLSVNECDMLASHAMKIIKEKKIQTLLFVDDNKDAKIAKLKGILHIHTLIANQINSSS